MNKTVILFMKLGMLVVCGAKEEAHWMVLNKIDRYGDDLTLICTLNGSISINDTKRWYKDEYMCSFNNHSTNPSKYKAQIVPRGIQLTILKFSHEDVNETYHCTIGFHPFQKQILSEDIVFKKQIPTKGARSGQSEKGGNNTALLVTLGTILLSCAVFIGLLIKFRVNLKRFFRSCYALQQSSDLETSSRTSHNQNEELNDQDQVQVIDETSQAPENELLLNDGVIAENPLNGTQAAEEFVEEIANAEETSVLEDSCAAQSATDSDDTNPKVVDNSGYNRENFLIQNNARGPLVRLHSNGESMQHQLQNSSQNNSNCVARIEAIGKNTALVVSGKTVNVPFQSEKTAEGNEVERTDSKIPHREPINRGFQFTLPDSSSNRTQISEPTHTHKEYDILSLRESSFTEPLLVNFPSIAVLAAAGFFYTGYDNRVRCFSCGKLHNVEEGEKPIDSSYHESNCPYLKGKEN